MKNYLKAIVHDESKYVWISAPIMTAAAYGSCFYVMAMYHHDARWWMPLMAFPVAFCLAPMIVGLPVALLIRWLRNYYQHNCE